MSTTTSQVTLPGQEHTAEGPHDQTGMYVMHHALRRDLDRFVSAARRTPVGAAATWTALLRRWDRFAETLHHHHQIEDQAIWPVLLAHTDRLGDTAGRATLEAMEAEHGTIDPALTACRAGLARMVDHPSEDHRAALDVRLTDLRQALAGHLRHEETEALPLLQRVMTEAEFAASEKAAAAGYPARMVPFLVPWATEGLPAEASRRLLGSAGPGYGLLLRLTRPAFRRAERRAFRYA